MQFLKLATFALLTTVLSPKAFVVANESIDFNEDIRSLLSNNCLMCHGPDEEERAAGLRLDTEEGAHEDLGGYAAIAPGDPDESELLLRIVSDDEDLKMPPPGKGRPLTPDEVQLVRRWISQGGRYDKHWSYQKPVRPDLPPVKKSGWPRSAIDHFVLAKLEQANLQPSPEADRFAIARRVALDLTGLPPTWNEAMQFVQDSQDNAYEAYVDRLLAKQSFGERWGRVWLDLARYADSAGYADDPPRTIWAFRDYVIRSLNDNKPFDQFTIEQIAGDLLEDPTEEQLIATAFHRNTLTNNEGGTNNEEFRNVAVADRVNTTMAVWMGTTMACAQCHTHKYDPITHEEYFRFFAFFNSSQDADLRDESPIISIWSKEQQIQRHALEKQIAQLKTQIARPSDELNSERQEWIENVSTPPDWADAKPLAARSESRELSIASDGNINASDERPEFDTYDVDIQSSTDPLTAVQIVIPDQQDTNFVITKVKAHWSPANSDDANVSAKFLRVEVPGKKKFVHLAEIQAFSGEENIALTAKATQSSTYSDAEAKRVNDGNTDGDYKKQSVSHTQSQTSPWIELEFSRTLPIDKIVIFNRTDGGSNNANRLSGYRVELLDESRNVFWSDTPATVPNPSEEFVLTGKRELSFAAAIADFSQKGFPARSVLAAKTGDKTGWAIAPKTGQQHQLSLLLAEPMLLPPGVITIRIAQDSKHQQHVLNHFKLRTSSSKSAKSWAEMPRSIRDLIQVDQADWTPQQANKVANYHSSVSRLLNKQNAELQRTEAKLASMKPSTTVPVMRDLAADKRRTTNIQIRGNYLSIGAEVTEGTPAEFHPLPDTKPERSAPNRLDLAHWLIDKDNPLTARVIANRHWEQLFGTGIVETSEEFGSQGELPSHPELLDWLAVELRDGGWDIKRFIKMIVMSATYRQSSASNHDAIETDPFNRMLARGPRFRISAEMVRDQALFVSGLLSNKMYGEPVNPPQPALGLKAAFGSATDWKTSGGDDKYRRGIYTMWRRSSPYPSMAQFDAPNREVCTVRRIRTNTPLQALVTLNDPVFVEAAQALARRMIVASDSSDERVQYGIRNSLIRNATTDEVRRLTGLADDAYKHFLSRPDEAKQMATDPLGDLPDKSQDVALYAAWTVVGNVILNLDEIFMKR